MFACYGFAAMRKSQQPQLLHPCNQPLCHRAGRFGSVAGVLDYDYEGVAGVVGRGVAGRPGVVPAIAAGLGGAGFASESHAVAGECGVGRAFFVFDGGAHAAADGGQGVGREAVDFARGRNFVAQPPSAVDGGFCFSIVFANIEHGRTQATDQVRRDQSSAVGYRGHETGDLQRRDG